MLETESYPSESIFKSEYVIDDSVNNAIVIFNDIYDDYVKKAQELVEIYWIEWTYKKRSQPEKLMTTFVGPRVKFTKKGSSYSIAWCYWSYIGSRNSKNSVKYSHHIRKGTKNDSYRLNEIYKYAQPWERELVKRFEDLFTQIRSNMKKFRNLRNAAVKANEQHVDFQNKLYEA